MSALTSLLNSVSTRLRLERGMETTWYTMVFLGFIVGASLIVYALLEFVF